MNDLILSDDLRRSKTRMEKFMGVKKISMDDLFQYIEEIKGRKVRQIRDVEPISSWVRSEYYLGDEARTLYPFWEDAIVECVEGGYTEFIATGSLRSGKTTCANILTKRKFYELSCFKPIPGMFGLSSTSQILFMYLSLTVKQANRMGMGRVKRMIDASPYFQECFPRKTNLESEIHFKMTENLIMIGGSELGHFQGSDLYLLVFDEANFAKGAADQRLENAVNIYREATNRRKMTFMVDGEESGLSIIVSSAETETSFVEERIRASKSNPKSLVVNAVQYEVQPWRYKGMKKFWVFKGDDTVDPFIVKQDRDSLRNFCKVNGVVLEKFKVKKLDRDLRPKFAHVPIAFWDTFELDIFGALKEVCGVAVGQEGRFFSNRVKFANCFPKERKGDHPFTKREFAVSYLDTTQIMEFFDSTIEFNPNYEYFGGIDQSATNDNTGVALCHIDPKNPRFKVTFDFILRILAPKKPAKISPDKIVDFFIFLKRKCGAKNMKVFMDWWAALQSVQKLHIHGIDAEVNSVDRDWDSYRSLAGSILDECVEGYHHQVFKKEFFALLQDNIKKKVDHPADGSKDVSDAVCQAHTAAIKTYLEITAGIRYFPSFGQENLKIIAREITRETIVGMYFGPEAFYVCWFFVKMRNNEEQIYVFDEYLDEGHSDEHRAEQIKQRSTGMNATYAGDPGEFARMDLTGVTPDKRFQQLGIPVYARKYLDRDNFGLVRQVLGDESGTRLFLDEHKTPLMARAFRRAKFKMKGIIKTKALDNTGEEYPLYALRFGLEEVFVKGKVSAH